LAVFEEYAATRVREWEDIHAQTEGEFPQRARAYADQWMERLGRDPDFMVLTLEFLVHAWRHPPLRAAFADRAAAGRLALARILGSRPTRRGWCCRCRPKRSPRCCGSSGLDWDWPSWPIRTGFPTGYSATSSSDSSSWRSTSSSIQAKTSRS